MPRLVTGTPPTQPNSNTAAPGRGLLTSTETVPRLETPLLKHCFRRRWVRTKLSSGTVPHTRARQIFCTVDRLTPNCLAIVPVLQCVSPLDLECRVASTIASTVCRDRRWAARAQLQPLANRVASPHRPRSNRRIRVLATPSAAINSARADLSMRSLTTSATCYPSGRPGEEVMDRARLRPGGHRRRVDGPVRGDDRIARGRGTLPRGPATRRYTGCVPACSAGCRA